MYCILCRMSFVERSITIVKRKKRRIIYLFDKVDEIVDLITQSLVTS